MSFGKFRTEMDEHSYDCSYDLQNSAFSRSPSHRYYTSSGTFPHDCPCVPSIRSSWWKWSNNIHTEIWSSEKLEHSRLLCWQWRPLEDLSEVAWPQQWYFWFLRRAEYCVINKVPGCWMTTFDLKTSEETMKSYWCPHMTITSTWIYISKYWCYSDPNGLGAHLENTRATLRKQHINPIKLHVKKAIKTL